MAKWQFEERISFITKDILSFFIYIAYGLPNFILMSANLKPGIPGVISTSTSGRLPAEVTKTGTISHENATTLVIGVGTLFMSELKVGQWIYANSVLRKITDLESNTRLQVNATFGGTLSGVALKTCESGAYRFVRIENVHASVAATVLGVSVPAGKHVEYKEAAGVEPLFYDGTSSTLLISTLT